MDLSRKWLRREVEKRPVSRVRIEIPLKYQRLIEAALAYRIRGEYGNGTSKRIQLRLLKIRPSGTRSEKTLSTQSGISKGWRYGYDRGEEATRAGAQRRH